ncbi:sensor histidine kinase, partial [Acidimicrobiaceae bacterium USS-CC1]|nr:sensor histidine kinase [Acidiferrimicrobium australe]
RRRRLSRRQSGRQRRQRGGQAWVDAKVVGALAALDSSAPAGLLRLSAEVGEFVSTQLALAELDRSKERATRAELRFLRAQISPHFVYNALTAIESYVRSDPDRARELLVAFADFTRYSFAPFRQTTTIADELRLVDLYLDLARARFGDRFSVQLRVAPEVLSVRVPSLILQPVVENALRHGLEPNGHGTLSISVEDADAEAVLSVDDDGVGVEPARMRHLLDGTSGEEGVGLHNVDERLRAVFGEGHGLVVETGKGAGTRVTMRIPKSSTGVRVA